jgi:predicted kinase
MEAVIFVGLPGSGKSTFYKERFFLTHVRINLDMLRTRNREQILLQACLHARQPFVVDNTNTTIERRTGYISAAKAAGFRVSGYYFAATMEECKERNRLREGKARVPDMAIWRFSRELQVPVQPEGFDEIYYVHTEPDGRFRIEPLPGTKETER